MNIKQKHALLLVLIVLTISGCNECRNDDCPPNATFLFQVNDSQGVPLFDPINFHQTIESDEIRIVGMNSSGNEKEIRLWHDKTVLRFDVSAAFTNYIIDYAMAKDDTLHFTIEKYNDNCCSDIVTKYQVEVNSNDRLVPSSADSIFVFTK